MSDILVAQHPFQVCSRIVRLLAVNMVNLVLPSRGRANEGNGYEAMNLHGSASRHTAYIKPELQITVSVEEGLTNLGQARASSAMNAPNPPQIAYLIPVLILRHWTPFFAVQRLWRYRLRVTSHVKIVKMIAMGSPIKALLFAVLAPKAVAMSRSVGGFIGTLLVWGLRGVSGSCILRGHRETSFLGVMQPGVISAAAASL